MEQKIETLRDEDNQVKGYKLGNYYLLKRYYFDSSMISWYIATSESLSADEINEEVGKGNAFYVSNAKEGRQTK